MPDHSPSFKKDEKQSHTGSGTNWDFDPRNESYYLGKINKKGTTDLNMRYFTDGETGRFYRRDEIIPQQENVEINKIPFKNNSFEGKRKRNFSFRLPGRKQKNS